MVLQIGPRFFFEFFLNFFNDNAEYAAASAYSVIHQYLFMADSIFEHLKYQLDPK
jgi:hypothetical protein